MATTKLPRPPHLKRLPTLPKGPRWFQELQRGQVVGGPGDPPPGFVTNTTSKSEWWFYFGMAKATGDPEDPRKPPYFGGRNWDYQRIYDNLGAGSLATASVDFIYYAPYEIIGIRIQTFQYHIGTTPEQKGYDYLQLQRLGKRMRVVDVIEQRFINDPTGQAAVIAAKESLGFIRTLNPLDAGTNIFHG